MSCILNTKFDNKPSYTHIKLIEQFGQDENSLLVSQEIYEQLKTAEFKRDLGVDWEMLRDEVLAGQNVQYDAEMFTHQLEPQPYFNSKGLLYFLRADGSKKFVRSKPLEMMTEREQKQVVNGVLFEAIGGEEGLVNMDFDAGVNIGVDKILSPGHPVYDFYYNEVGLAQIDFDEIKSRIANELQLRQLKLNDTSDLVDQAVSEAHEDQAEIEGEDDINNDNSVVKKDSYTQNSKDTATANVKMLVSFVPVVESFSIDETGKVEVELAINDMEMYEFTNPNDIWRKLEDNLANIFTSHDGQNVQSVVDKMIQKVHELAQDDPNMGFILKKLTEMDINKRVQFAQAFTKQKIVFYTTEVTGTPGNYKFKFFDSATTSTKEFKIRTMWEEVAAESPFYKDLDGKKTIEKDKVKGTQDSLSKLTDKLKDVGKKNQVISDDDVRKIKKVMLAIGIPTSEGTAELAHNKALKEIHEKKIGGPYNETVAYLELTKMLKSAVDILAKATDKSIVNANGEFVNTLKANELTQLYANQNAALTDGISESTLMGAGNKMLWSFSLPTHVDIVINQITNGYVNGQNDFLNNLQALPYNANSTWIKYLKDNPDNKLKAVTFSAFQNQGKSAKGDDNKSIKYLDQLADQMNKMANNKRSSSEPSIYYSPTAADKGRLISLMGLPFVPTILEKSGNSFNINSESEAVYILSGYFEDEYNRMTQVWADKDSTNNKYVNYSLKSVQNAEGVSEWKSVDADGVPIGNGFVSQLFPYLSPKEINADLNKRLKLYDSQNKLKPLGLTDATRAELRKLISADLKAQVLANARTFNDKGAFTKRVDETTGETIKGVVNNNVLDSRLWGTYLSDHNNDSQMAAYNAIADYTINGMIANTEYSKIFSGDPAYYKTAVDYNKRIPATYTDGKYLVGIDTVADMKFKTAVFDEVKISAHDLGTMESNFVDSLKAQREHMPEDIKAKYTDVYINALAKSYTSQYKGINSTDAQGYITLNRWKFLKQKLGDWNSKSDGIFDRIKNGTFTHDDYKYAAQPLKGVYFNMDERNGVPTYLKYSQTVLLPELTKGTQMDKIRKMMESQGISELISVEGVKSGALQPSRLHDAEGNVVENPKVNTYDLSNLHWKLQQQLPVKGMKDTMDLGSQMQKNIISNIIKDADYGGATGQELVDRITNATNALTEIGFQEALGMLGANADGTINNMDTLYETLIDEARSKGMPSYVISALERGYSLDATPQLRYKSQNIISSIVNKRVGKTNTPGASFIQMSDFGISKAEIVNNVKTDRGIYMLKDVDRLDRPKFYKNAEGKDRVSSGQIFLPHGFIAKHIPNYKEMDRADLMKIVDDRLMNIIGYRIPNQKISSNQALEVVGILPESMGDSVMMYTEIPTQTGSDFDIDKTYIMLPAYRAVYEGEEEAAQELASKMSVNEMLDILTRDSSIDLDYIKSLKAGTNEAQVKKNIAREIINEGLHREYISLTPKLKRLQYTDSRGDSKGAHQNALFEAYTTILTSPLTFADSMSGIDGTILQKTINEIHGKQDKLAPLQLANPAYQLSIKFDNMAGKTGVGLTANQMVDHVYGQMYNMTQKFELGIGNKSDSGEIDLSGTYDTDGNKITDSISMFLNAFVDIAKDPYVTKGNFNEVTSNAVFLMLRAGVPLDFVIKYIGQPAFKKVVDKVLDNQSKLGASRRGQFKDYINEVKREYEIEFEKYRNSVTSIYFNNALDKNSDLSTISKTELVDNIKGKQFSDDMNLRAEFYGAQIGLLDTLMEIYDPAEQLAGQVLASKADVKGGGGDIVTHFINNNRFNKVLDDNKFGGLESKFGPNSILGPKTEKTVQFLNKLNGNIYITMNEGVRDVYNVISDLIYSQKYATNNELVKGIERAMYAHYISEAVKDTPYQLDNVESMFIGERTIASRVAKAKLQDDLQDNVLIQNLEITKNKDGYSFIGLDNFLNKPTSSLEDLNRSWENLFNSETYNALATDMVKYAIASSGFSKNRNSIYEVLPIHVSDTINNRLTKMRYMEQDGIASMEKFVSDFMRQANNRGDKNTPGIVPNISGKVWGEIIQSNNLQTVSTLDKKQGLGKLAKEMKVQGNDIMMVTLSGQAMSNDATKALERIETGGVVYIKGQAYMNHGKMIDRSETLLLAKTHTLGYFSNSSYIYEYGRTQNNSSIASNNPKNYENIKKLVEMIKRDTLGFEEQSIYNKIAEERYSQYNRIQSGSLTRLLDNGTMKNKC